MKNKFLILESEADIETISQYDGIIDSLTLAILDTAEEFGVTTDYILNDLTDKTDNVELTKYDDIKKTLSLMNINKRKLIEIINEL